jgi:hypothetical protein
MGYTTWIKSSQDSGYFPFWCVGDGDYSAFDSSWDIRQEFGYNRIRISNGGQRSSYDFNHNDLNYDGNWHHLVVQRTPGDILQGFWDGSSIGTISLNNLKSFGDNLYNVYVGYAKFKGGSGAPYYAKGVLDDIRIYNRALSKEEIKLLYELKNDTKSPANIPVNDVPWEWVGPFIILLSGFTLGGTGTGFVCLICKLRKSKNKHKYKRIPIKEEKFEDIEMKRQRIFDSDDEDHEIPNPLEGLIKERERSCRIIKEHEDEDILIKSIKLVEREKEGTSVTLGHSGMFFNQKTNLPREQNKQENDNQTQKNQRKGSGVKQISFI